jgi:hypothetical protein
MTFSKKRPATRSILLAGALASALCVSACVGEIGDAGAPGIETPGLAPARAPLRRLLARQYRNAIADLLGEAAAAAVTPPDDVEVNGFESIGAAQLVVGDDAVSKYEASARAAAAAAMNDLAGIAFVPGCSPTGQGDAACHAEFVRGFGSLAWRRLLTTEEIADYVHVAQQAAQARGDFYAGIEHAIAALLQSPNFLYRIEIGEPIEGNATVRRLGSFELATKMSFFLLDTTPDAQLLNAAE